MRNKIYHIISIFLLVAFVTFCCIFYWKIFLRTKQVGIEFGTSIANYVGVLFQTDFGIKNQINQSNYIEGFSFTFLPDMPENFWLYLRIVFQQLVSEGYWNNYTSGLLKILLLISQLSVFVIPLIFISYFVLMNSYYSDHERNVAAVSRQLIWYRNFKNAVGIVKENIKDFFRFFKSKKYYFIPMVILLLYFTNLINIAIAVLGYYFYLVSTLDLSSFWQQVVRFFTDLSHLMRKEFSILWIILFVTFFRWLFKKIADSRKRFYLEKNKFFVKEEVGLATLFKGTMAKGKTTLMTDCALTTESVFKDMAFEMMVENSSLFPEIDFKSIEEKLNEKFFETKEITIAESEKVERSELYNLSTIRSWCKKYVAQEYKGYTVECGGFTYNLYDVIFNYCQLYWVYTSPTSLILSNYSVRSGIFSLETPHLPENFEDFMESNEEYFASSNYAHIFDFNNFRTGKQMQKRLEWSKAVDIGVFNFDEIGKERLNKVELEDVKKGSDDVNQKNDGFNKTIKMGRHQSTIDNFPFFKIFAADQRESSVPADYRELNDVIVDIKPETKDFNVYPFYSYFNWILTGFKNFCLKWFERFRHNRDDLTFVFQLTKDCLGAVVRKQKSLFNRYGVKQVPISLANGSGVEYKNTDYYLVISKIYSNRFATDAYADFFEQRGLESKVGLNEIPTYETKRATLDELSLQNSYFIDSLKNHGEEESNKGKNRKGDKYGKGKRTKNWRS